jgi:hypothetical protein
MLPRLSTFLSAAALLTGTASGQQWGPWYAAGPFAHDKGYENLQERHAPEQELSAMRTGRGGPELSKVYSGEDFVEAPWREVAGGSTAFDVGTIEFAKVLPAIPGKKDWVEYSAAYLYRKAEMGVERDVRVHLGSDDGVKLWLNGELFFERSVGRGVNLYDESLVLPMREGTNHLLVMVVNGQGGWGFRMGPWRTPQAIQIDQAVERGVTHILDQQLIDGSWGYMSNLEPGPSAFRLYTLLKCGVRAAHPAIRRGRAFILAHENNATYSLSTKILALAEMDEEGDRGRIEDLLDELWAGQLEDGLFRYSVNGYHSQNTRGDLSNALFAGLAMRSASKVGVVIGSNRWAALADGALACWCPSDGRPRTGGEIEARGFSYTPGRAPTSSMVVAGVSLLAIADEQAGDRIRGRRRLQMTTGIRTGLAWLDEHFTWTTNVGHGAGHHNFFSVYGVERVGGLLDLPAVANRDWYYEGSQQLLKWQSAGGTWSEKNGHVETELALLFLKRATAPASGRHRKRGNSSWSTAADPGADMVLRGSGDTPATIWIESFRADLLSDLEWAGQEGLGPHVSCVDFFARRDVPGGRVTKIARIVGDSMMPSRGERYAIRHQFPANGSWLVHARVYCREEAKLAGVMGDEVELVSEEMEIRVRSVITDEQLSYAEEVKENRLRSVKTFAKASSEIKGEEAERAVDGRYDTRWHCATTDSAPKLKLSFTRSVRGRKIALAHGWPRPAYRKSARPLRGELIINGRGSFPFEMDPDPMTKTVIDLGHAYRIRTLEVKITHTLGGVLGSAAFGFSEVEVYRR